jgi:ABC-type multidrug transport system fused ATPase/permease subunit
VTTNPNQLYSALAPDSTIDKPRMVLNQINLNIEPGEKIAICGRTGSGKSSLISLLLKLLDPLSGTITVDGISLKDIDRSALRQSIFAMPQEAVFLPDGTTFHLNLDPSGVSTFEECEAVLALVGLLPFVQERGGLTAGMDAATLSAGQRQLMSLCRVILRRRIRATSMDASSHDKEGGVLILDEVSSNVDPDTERAMQDIIHVEFKRFTILAVSHRLNMIMDFDRVIVLDDGKIVETGNPAILGKEESSRFGKLVKASRY